MSRPEPEPQRCVEVMAYRADGKLDYGSGYRVTSGLVLTAEHVLRAAERVEVRFSGMRMDVEIAERDPDRDLALLRLPGGVLAGLLPLTPVRLGVLPEDSGQVEFCLIGFPVHGSRPAEDGRVLRDDRQVNGTLQLGSGTKSGLLALSVTSAPPPEPSAGTRDADPWTGTSGAAVFARPGGELVGVVRLRAPGMGVRSLDATEFRLLLTGNPLLARLEDAGVRFTRVEVGPEPQDHALHVILTHDEVLAQLSEKHRFLVADRLPFVSPGADRPEAPEAIFSRLNDTEGGHVLLVGGASSGKTRTCFEVAAIARSHGWRVYHAPAHQRRELTNRHLESVVLDADTPALVIIDGVEEFGGLDLAAIPGGLDDEARRRGVTFRLLATTRPRQAKMLDPAIERSVVERITMTVTAAHAAAVRDAIVRAAAPRALERFGAPDVAGYCGRTPVLALLKAIDLEARIDAEDAPLRLPGNTAQALDWLAEGLDKDALKPHDPPPDDVLADRIPGAALVATAAMAAVGPQPRGELLRVAGAVLAERNGVPHTAERLLDTLVDRGWLVRERGRFGAVHDLLTDELLKRTLLPNDDAPVDLAVVGAILDAALGGPLTFARAVAALSRMMRDLPERYARRLGAACTQWLSGRAEQVAELLRDSPTHQGGEALGALLGGPPWTVVVLERWNLLAAPWLSRHGAHHGARRSLTLCLRRLPYHLSNAMVGTALRWLDSYGDEPEAGFVIQALVVKTDLGAAERERLAVHTSRWLAVHARDREAGRLLALLVRRADRFPRAAGVHAAAAQRWLALYASESDALPVLRAGLDSGRPGLVAASLLHGEAWLARHASAPGAADILIPVLRETVYFRPKLRVYTLTWLNAHGTSGRAALVISALLRRDRILDGTLRAVAVDKAADLLNSREIRGKSLDLLESMLRRDDPDAATRVVAAALGWLGRNAAQRRARRLVGVLLARPGLPDEMRRIGAEKALEFIGSQPPSVDSGRLLRPLLNAPDPEVAARARAESLAFLQHFGTRVAACHILRALLDASGLTSEQGAEVVERSFAWLERNEGELHAWRVLNGLLQLPQLPDQSVRRAAASSLRWLEKHGQSEEAGGALIVLLALRGLDPATRATIQVQAHKWLTTHRRGRAHNALAQRYSQAKAREAALRGKRRRGRMSGRRAQAATGSKPGQGPPT